MVRAPPLFYASLRLWSSHEATLKDFIILVTCGLKASENHF